MVNGLPGNVAAIVAQHALLNDRFELIPYSLTGPEINDSEYSLDSVAVGLIKPDQREAAISRIKSESGAFISIDYTHPSAVNANAEFYCAHNLHFVMGTTGGDRKQLADTVLSSSIAAVIAPNMVKQIVGFQAMMEYASVQFPDLFKGYSLEITESHQQGKADTSGTAKAMVGYFNRLGVPFDEQDIIKERDPAVQQAQWQIPADYLSGHGWHTYTLLSADETVTFQFKHNVNGRNVYALGTIDAVLFLHAKIAAGVKGEMFSMIDVLKGL